MSKRKGRCGTCDDRLTMNDYQKTTGQYWVNCKTCRDKHTAAKRRRRAQKAFDNSFIDNRSYSNDSYEYDGWDSELYSDPNGDSWISNAPMSATQPPPGPSPRPPVNHSRPMLTPVSRINRDRQQGSIRTSINTDRRGPGAANKSNPIVKKEKDNDVEQDLQERFYDAPEELRPSMRECSGCATNYPVQEFPSLMSCAHTPEFCHECFLHWLETRMREVEQVQCPSSGCTNTITHEDVQRYALGDLYTRFDQLSTTRLLKAEPDFLHCIAKGCSSGQIHVTGVEGPIFCCVACHFRMCTAHDPPVPFHEDESCAQYTERIAREERYNRTESRRIRKEQNEASVALVKRVSVRCPGCKTNIQKSDGCDHMTCSNKGCGYEFCYLCRANYSGRQGIFARGNHAHRRSCPHYRRY